MSQDIPEDVFQALDEWLIAFSPDEKPTPDLLARCEVWLNPDPRHAQAYLQIYETQESLRAGLRSWRGRPTPLG